MRVRTACCGPARSAQTPPPVLASVMERALFSITTIMHGYWVDIILVFVAYLLSSAIPLNVFHTKPWYLYGGGAWCCGAIREDSSLSLSLPLSDSLTSSLLSSLLSSTNPPPHTFLITRRNFSLSLFLSALSLSLYVSLGLRLCSFR